MLPRPAHELDQELPISRISRRYAWAVVGQASLNHRVKLQVRGTGGCSRGRAQAGDVPEPTAAHRQAGRSRDSHTCSSCLSPRTAAQYASFVNTSHANCTSPAPAPAELC